MLTPEIRKQLFERGKNIVEHRYGPMEAYDYDDNYRVALVSDPVSLWVYEEQRYSGCCGSLDIGFATEWGMALFGFNYGH